MSKVSLERHETEHSTLHKNVPMLLKAERITNFNSYS